MLTEEKKTLFTVYIGYFLDVYGSPSLSFVDTYGKTFFPSESPKLRCQMRIFKQIFQNLKFTKGPYMIPGEGIGVLSVYPSY